MSTTMSRRQLLQMSAFGAASPISLIASPNQSVAQSFSSQELDDTQSSGSANLRYCLNSSTIREQQLSLPELIELAAEVGYDGIEPWIREIQTFEREGGRLEDCRKMLDDFGLQVENAIGFASWIVDDATRRASALEQAKREMELVRRLGGERIAAPPAGATDVEDMNLLHAAERYGELLQVGREMGVRPQLELWGFSKTLHRLGELAFVAAECGEPDAAILPDVYHIYKGGSDFHGLNLISVDRIEVFHMNDYPADPPRDSIRDADRVYPGDGVAPLDTILGGLIGRGFGGTLSLELFNPEYWKLDARVVAETGLEKMQRSVRSAQEWLANQASP